MSRKPLSRLALAFAAFLAAGCLSEPGKEPEREVGDLYRCIGEPGYSGDPIGDILAEWKVNPPVCTDGIWSSRLGRSMTVSDSSADSVAVHLIVLDDQCNLIRESRSTQPDMGEHIRFDQVFEAKDGRGNPLPTGEYYVNAEIMRGAAKDTSYQKIGWIRDPCAP